MGTAFISSVIGGFEEYRQAAKEAVELMDHSPIMSENFAARPYSPEVACINEAEQSDIYLLILGSKYGFETGEGISVTHAEFRAARTANRPILAFIQQCEMEPKQYTFKEEVEAYQGGVFRASFTTAQELKDQVIRALRQLETMSQAVSEEEFKRRIDAALGNLTEDWNSEPELILAFLPQPERMVDIVGLEAQLDAIFNTLCQAGLAQFRDGYEPKIEPHWTGLETGKVQVAYFPDGLIVLLTNPTAENDGLFSGHFAPPGTIQNIANGFRDLINANSGYVCIELRNMSNAYVADQPEGNSFSMKIWGDDNLGFSRLFAPLTAGTYQGWIKHCINRFKRQFAYKTD
ncbi:MAG TPA: DUF4062 domain-containing protein [Sedimenticola sp.]|nr:DUF4062 domain-containing protein [Sedimenticola sp.]